MMQRVMIRNIMIMNSYEVFAAHIVYNFTKFTLVNDTEYFILYYLIICLIRQSSVRAAYLVIEDMYDYHSCKIND